MSKEPFDLFIAAINASLKALGQGNIDSSDRATARQLYNQRLGLSPIMLASVFYFNNQAKQKVQQGDNEYRITSLKDLQPKIFDNKDIMSPIYNLVHTRREKLLDDEERQRIKADLLRYLILVKGFFPLYEEERKE